MATVTFFYLSINMSKIFLLCAEIFLRKRNRRSEILSCEFWLNPNQTIINDFSVDVKPGQKIAIVGPTGAGKTTMVKLLMRFYDVNSGQILLDNHDVRDYNRRDLRKAFGMVLQDTWLYKGTIMENIRYGRLDATDEEVIYAQ